MQTLIINRPYRGGINRYYLASFIGPMVWMTGIHMIGGYHCSSTINYSPMINNRSVYIILISCYAMGFKV